MSTAPPPPAPAPTPPTLAPAPPAAPASDSAIRIEADGSLTVTGAALRPILVYEPVIDTEPLGQQLLALTRPHPWRSLPTIAFDWAVIASTIAVVEAFWHPALWLLAIFVIGGRQHALATIMHEGAHFRLLPNRRWNERIANWFAAYTMLVSTDGYRKDHLQHHYHLNTDKDPNHTSKIGQPDWMFPKRRLEIAWIFLKELLGVGFFRIGWFVLRYLGNSRKQAERKGGSGGLGAFADRLIYYAVVFGAIGWFGAWRGFLLYWFVPLISVLPALLRLRVIAEHHGLERTNDLTHSRTYKVGPLERFFFAPHNINYHIEHHLFPSIPWYNLPKAHALLWSMPGYGEKAHESDAILLGGRKSVLADITGALRASPAPAG